MVHGGVEREVLQLNEDTVWAGGPQNNVDPSLKPYLEQITELVFANRHEEAQAFANEHLYSTNHGMPYQTVGSLVTDQQPLVEGKTYRQRWKLTRAFARIIQPYGVLGSNDGEFPHLQARSRALHL